MSVGVLHPDQHRPQADPPFHPDMVGMLAQADADPPIRRVVGRGPVHGEFTMKGGKTRQAAP
jgi:hypothetical protein